MNNLTGSEYCIAVIKKHGIKLGSTAVTIIILCGLTSCNPDQEQNSVDVLSKQNSTADDYQQSDEQTRDDLRIAAIINQIEAEYQLQLDKIPEPLNPHIERMQRFAFGFDTIFSQLYGYSVSRLSCQKTIPQILEYLMDHPWYSLFLVRVTDHSDYQYTEHITLRIIIATHIAAAVFELPYPTLICLLFHESKFQVSARSHTGALGIGQLTTIALKQFEILRKNEIQEERLQTAAIITAEIYQDPIMLEILHYLGFQPWLPNPGRFPERIERHQLLTNSMIREIADEVRGMGYEYGNDLNLIRSLVADEIRGKLVPERYAAVHPAIIEVVERKYGQFYGHVFHLETNIFISTMLLRYYYDYPWRIDGKRIRFQPNLRSTLAIAAYNQGPEPVKAFLTKISQDAPNINLETATAQDLKPLFTKSRISASLGHRSRRTSEIRRHVMRIRACAEAQR